MRVPELAAWAGAFALSLSLGLGGGEASLFYRDPGGFFRLAAPPGWAVEAEPVPGVQVAFRDAPGARARASLEVSSYPLPGVSLAEWVRERLAEEFSLRRGEDYRMVRQGYRRLGEAQAFEFVRQFGKGPARLQAWDLLVVHRGRALRVSARASEAEWARFAEDFRRSLYSLEVAREAEEASLSLRVRPAGSPLYRGTSPDAERVADLPEGARVRFLHRVQTSEGNWYHVEAEDPEGARGPLRGFLPAGRVRGEEAFEEALRRLGVGWRVEGAFPEPGRRVVVPFQREGSVILVPVELNRRERATFVLDTGATYTLISEGLARALGLSIPRDAARVRLVTVSGEVEAPLVRLGSVRVQGAEARDVEAVIHTIRAPGREVAGLLGLSFLRHFDVTIDSAQGQLILVRK